MGVKQSRADPARDERVTQYEGHEDYEAIGNSMGYVGAGFNPPFLSLRVNSPQLAA